MLPQRFFNRHFPLTFKLLFFFVFVRFQPSSDKAVDHFCLLSSVSGYDFSELPETSIVFIDKRLELASYVCSAHLSLRTRVEMGSWEGCRTHDARQATAPPQVCDGCRDCDRQLSSVPLVRVSVCWTWSRECWVSASQRLSSASHLELRDLHDRNLSGD